MITAHLEADEVFASETAAIMTSWWCWVSRTSGLFRSVPVSGRFLVAVGRQKSSRSGGVFSQSRVVLIALRVIALLSHVLCPASFLFLLQPTSTPTRSWDGERKPSRSVPWRRDTSTEFSCTNELSDWSSCPRETTRWAVPKIYRALTQEQVLVFLHIFSTSHVSSVWFQY